MNSDSIPVGAGRVTYWDLDDMDPEAPLAGQADRIKEDLAQIQFPKDVLVDVGWYPSFSSNGKFTVVVVENGLWDRPLCCASAKEIAGLKNVLNRAISIATGPDPQPER